MSSSALEGSTPRTTLHFNKTGKGEIEGTIMLLSSREKLKCTQKTKHTVNYDLCCTFIVTLHLRQGGEKKRKGLSIQVSRSSWQGKTGRKTNSESKGKQSEQPSLPPRFYCSALFLVYPPHTHIHTHLVKVQDLSFLVGNL